LLVASYKGPAARRDRHREEERLELYLNVVIASANASPNRRALGEAAQI
jgi:hypothetical protein